MQQQIHCSKTRNLFNQLEASESVSTKVRLLTLGRLSRRFGKIIVRGK
jgi:hypothetical protein